MIPVRPLVVDLSDVNKITLGEVALFLPDSGMTGPEIIVGMRHFLKAHTNWTQTEIDAIEMGELKQVGEQISEKMQQAAVPNGRKPRSKIGRGRKSTPFPAGPIS